MEIDNEMGGELQGATTKPITPQRPAMPELMKVHLDEVAGGLADHSDWNSRLTCEKPL